VRIEQEVAGAGAGAPARVCGCGWAFFLFVFLGKISENSFANLISFQTFHGTHTLCGNI
jgi:hypothetical protein